jgi:hypothetical protein
MRRARLLSQSLACLLLAAPLLAQEPADRWQQGVRSAMLKADSLAHRRGYAPTDVRLSGSLFIDEAESRTLPLDRAGSYLVVGVCDEDCSVLNLVLSNPKGDEVSSYREAGNAPFVEATATAAGEYRLRVIMLGCRRAPCRYGVAVFRKS